MSDEIEEYGALVGRLFAEGKLHVMKAKARAKPGLTHAVIKLQVMTGRDITPDDMGRLLVNEPPK